ncbi:MAG: hypothetical protein WBO08_13420, partial [Mycobacterium sp.]
SYDKYSPGASRPLQCGSTSINGLATHAYLAAEASGPNPSYRLEIWREIGLEREIRRRSAPLSELRTILYCTTVAGPELGRVPLMDLPPERLDAIGSVSDQIDFHAGWSYESHAQDDDGVAATVADLRTGQRKTAAPAT